MGSILTLRLSVRTRLAIIFIVMIIAPIVVILLLEIETKQELNTVLGIYLAGAITLGIPLVGVVSRWVVLNDLGRINRICQAVRKGSQVELFDLPNESDEEHELLALKRNINYMVHAVSGRESSLKDHLSKTAQERSRLWELSIRDQLSSLFNRRYFDQKIIEVVKEAGDSHQPCCLMIIDVDKFKCVNDEYGHPEGDRLIRILGRIILGSTRQDLDIPFRYGGDEFGVIFRNAETVVVVEVAKRIRARYLAARIGVTSLSLGIAPFCGQGLPAKSEADHWVKSADTAVYKAKALGGDRLVLNCERRLEVVAA